MKISDYAALTPVLVTLLVFGAGTVGCTSEEPASPDGSSVPAEGHHAHTAQKPGSTRGTGTGTVRSLSADGRSIVVSHGPIDGIGMGAMTMSFLVDDSIAIDGVQGGDEIAFAVAPAGSDFRITALCRPAVDGQDCADTL